MVLLERDELTSGSTWHAAGGMHTLNSDPNVAKLQDYTIRLYQEIEAISGQSCGIHLVGGLMLAGTPERLDSSRLRTRAAAISASRATDLDRGGQAQAAADRVQAFCRRARRPVRGPCRPVGRDPCLRQGAQMGGAEVYRFTPVTGLPRRGGWRAVTPTGRDEGRDRGQCRGLVGARGRPLVGLELPVLAMQHHDLITDEVPEVAARATSCRAAIDLRASSTCARRARACWSAPTSRTAALGCRATTPPDSATSRSRPTSIASPPPRGRLRAFPGARTAGISG